MNVFKFIARVFNGEKEYLEFFDAQLGVDKRLLEYLIVYSHMHKVQKIEYIELFKKLKNIPQLMIDQMSQEHMFEDATKKGGLSAIMRLKNDEEYVKASILSIYKYVDEVVCVLNYPEDKTAKIVEELSGELEKIKVYYYNTILESPREGYYEMVSKNVQASLAKYYNYAFSLASYSHVLKWDGDMIANENCKTIFRKATEYDVVSLNGSDILEEKTSVEEPRIYKASKNRFYVDVTFCEQLFIENSHHATCKDNLYIHMKLAKEKNYLNYLR